MNDDSISEDTVNDSTINDSTLNDSTLNDSTMNDDTISEDTVNDSTVNDSTRTTPTSTSTATRSATPGATTSARPVGAHPDLDPRSDRAPAPQPGGPVLEGGDPRDVLDRVLDVAVATVDAITPAQLALPTPCADFDVRDLLRHLHMAVSRAAAVPTIADPSELPIEDTTIADDGWSAAYGAAARAARTAWSADATLAREMHLPWMSAPGRHVLEVYLNEIIVHTWDLARATGQSPAWRDEDVDVAITAIHRELPVAERGPMWQAAQASVPEELAAARPWSDPFADAITLPPGAPAIDRLVAWCGRRP